MSEKKKSICETIYYAILTTEMFYLSKRSYLIKRRSRNKRGNNICFTFCERN